jgi:DNA sulfur modification protein DndD
MHFKELQLKNFIPYKGNQTIEFPSDKQRNVLIVFSDNEGGKTSLFNAIRWVLYGKAYTRHKAVIGLHQIFNKEAIEERENEFFVRLDYEADGINFSLKRMAVKKQGVAVPTKDDDFDVSLFLSKNGQEIARTQIDFEINQYLPEQVSRFFLFDGELLGEYEMLLDEQNDKGKQIKYAIEQVLGVPSLSKGKIDFETLRREANTKYNAEIAKQGNLDRYLEQKKKLYEQENAVKNSLSKSEDQLKEVQDEKRKIDDEIDDLSKSSELAQELKTNKISADNYENQIKEIDQKILSLRSDLYKDLLLPKLQILEKQIIDEINPVRVKLQSSGVLKYQIDEIQAFINHGSCSLCEQSSQLNETHKSLLNEKIQKLKNTLENTQPDELIFTDLGIKLESIRKLMSAGVLQQINSEKSNKTKCLVQITKLQNRNDEIRLQLDGQSEEILLKKQKRHDQLIADEALLKRSIQDQTDTLANLEKQIEANDELISRAADPKTKNSRAALLVDIYKKIENTFKDSIDNLRERLKFQVQEKASEAFLQLTNQKRYSGLRINANYGLSILDENGVDVNLRSAGAEQIVALSLIDGLSRTGRKAGPVIMDTPFARLDPNHRKNILNYLPKTASQFILFVHEGEVSKESAIQVLSQKLGMQYEIIRETVYRSKLVRM